MEHLQSVGNLMLIVAFANAFSWVAAIEKVPDEIAAMLMSISSNKYVLLMIVNVFYIFVGMIMDTGAAIILFAPIIGPVLTMVGVNPVHLAMVTIMNLTIGLLTPPVGLVLFTAVNVGKRPFGAVVKAFWPFIIISYLALFAVTFIPQIVTWLPGALGFQIALS